jgi:hypothetical protein
VDLSLQLTAFLVSKLFCKKVEIAIYILGSSLLNNQYSLSELFKYGKLLHKICISFTKRHLSLMYKGHSNKKCNSSSTLSRLQNKHFLCSRSSFFLTFPPASPIGKPRVSPLLSLNMMNIRNQPKLRRVLHPYIFHICQSLFVRNEH